MVRRRVLVLEGPGLDGRCRDWGAQAGLDIDLRAVDLRSALTGPGPAEAVVFAPGVGGFDSPAVAAMVAGAEVPVVAVECGNLRKHGVDPAGSAVGRVSARVLYGRGPDTARFALEHLAWRAARPAATIATVAYGNHPDQIGDLWMPDGPGPHPVAVLAHGGFWYHAWERDLMDGLSVDLAGRGWAAWNVEYRRVGAGGGWPATGEDMAAAIGHLVALAPVQHLDLDRVVLLGHSAGGQLVLWAAAGPAAGQGVRPRLVVGLAALADLRAARTRWVGGRSVTHLLATAADRKAALRDASPRERVPLGVPQILAHAVDDDIVPFAQTAGYAQAARAAGDAVDVLQLPAGGHFGLVDPGSVAWAAVRRALEEHGRARG